MARLPRTHIVWILLLGFAAAPLRADDDGVQVDVPVEVEAVLRAKDAAATGRVVLALTFKPLADLDRPYTVQLRLAAFRNEVLTLDHAADPPVARWKKGKPVTYEVPVPLPLHVKPGSRMELYLGFYDPERKRVYPPQNEGPRLINRVRLATFEIPDFGPLEAGPAVDALLGAAGDLAAQGREADAWAVLEQGIRRAVEDGPKYRFRDALLSLMRDVRAPPLSVIEKEIVAGRIRTEKERYLRRISGRCFDRKQWHAALRILEAIGGRLSEDAGAAVIGALDQAKRTQRDIDDLKVRILRSATDEDKAAAGAAVEKLGYTPKLMAKAEAWVKERAWARADLALRSLGLNAPDRKLSRKAVELRKQVEQSWLADTPPEQQQIVDDAVNHPVWARTTTSVSQKFIYIGPKTLVETLPAMSKLRFDLAYVFLTDLFGRVPNPGGDRVTVYFKELWDFGGGVGGGKIIDIGRAKPDQRGRRIDNGLLYHELTHCVDDTNPILKGWREGLANVGAAYAYEALGQTSDSLHSFGTNLRAFREDYLARDIAYWRMQNYGPSAGFFLHFVDKYAKKGRLHDWKPYRQFFREYRAAPVRDGRVPYVARAVAYYLIRAFGPKAFDDLVLFRLPLREDDRDAVRKELQAFAEGGYGVERMSPLLEKHHGSPIPRDLIAGKMMGAYRQQRYEEAERISREELGVIHEWKVIGPFKERGVSPMAGVFPPEHEIDYTKEYPGEANMCSWRDPKKVGVVERHPTGWIKFNFAYQDETATYALSFLTVPEDTDAYLHVRADDDVVVFLNDRLVENYLNVGSNASTPMAWRGPYAPVPDAMKLGVRLQRGRNKLLVKVRNRRGDAGFILAAARPSGLPIKGLVVDTKASPTDPTSGDAGSRAARAKKLAWKSVLKMNFKRKSFSSKLKVAVGEFKVIKKALTGEDTDGRVGWRKYTVRPGFPKDSPSNLLWVKPKYTEGLDELKLALDCRTRNGDAPKLVVTLQGNGGNDALSGWNLIVHPRGKGRVGAQLERYDHLFYQAPPKDLSASEDGVYRLEVTLHDRRIRVTMGDVVLFAGEPITPIPEKHRVGIATYGPGVGFEKLELYRVTKKR
ncbi:MAG: hypothetical protein QNJ90_10755 [Planctomycetota bacterium]|nr:hypothetical protein [Planctomycetota bacterium]